MQKQEERISEEETIFIYLGIHFKNFLKQIIGHHFLTNKDLERTGHNICHVVTENQTQKLFSSKSAQRSYSGEITLLTEAAIASSSEVQNFKRGSSNNIASVPPLSRLTGRGFLHGCKALRTTGKK